MREIYRQGRVKVTTEQLLERITRLAVALDVELKDARMKIYLEELADMTISEMEIGLDVRRYIFFPTIKEIREIGIRKFVH